MIVAGGFHAAMPRSPARGNVCRASPRLGPMTGNAVRDAYAGRAEEYTALLGSMANTRESDQRLVAQWARDLQGAVIDAGCGPGHWTDFLKKRGVNVEGIDQVQAFIGQARKRSRSESRHWTISRSETDTQLQFLRGTPLSTLPRVTCQRFYASSPAVLPPEAASSSGVRGRHRRAVSARRYDRLLLAHR